MRGTRVVGLSYFLSCRSREVYSETLRHDVQHPRRARSVLHGDYHIACHIVGAPHEGEEGGGGDEGEEEKRRMRKRRANERWQRHRMEENEEDVDANRIAIYPRARRL